MHFKCAHNAGNVCQSPKVYLALSMYLADFKHKSKVIRVDKSHFDTLSAQNVENKFAFSKFLQRRGLGAGGMGVERGEARPQVGFQSAKSSAPVAPPPPRAVF